MQNAFDSNYAKRIMANMNQDIDIKAIRQKLGLTQHQLGEMLGGVHQSTVGRWENGITVPRGPALKALLALKAEAEALMHKREAA